MTMSESDYLARLRDALVALRTVREERDALLREKNEPIAIIGMACRFPAGSAEPQSFWRTIIDGVDPIRVVPPERWPKATIPENRIGAYAGLVDGHDRLDLGFFELSPREAESLDPQHRMLLEVAWEALENAGLPADALVNTRTGVFVGQTSTEYQHRTLVRGAEQLDMYCLIGNMPCVTAGRLSHFLGLQGPSLSIDTACSSSLVAVVQAFRSLRLGESDIAIAGGVNAIVSPWTMRMAMELQALSPDGRCRTFDALANGFVRSEGCGVIVLKRLSDAARDGDRILALIRGGALNQDGRSASLTAPNVLAQQALLQQALESARLSPADIDYVETHGTGTPLGDPIEAEALRQVFGEPRADGSRLVLGALKTNVGHLEGAAGVAGLMKAVLCLQHGVIPKNLHFRTLNPRISLEGTPLVIPTENVPWERGAKPRRAGVSAFGLSGTNAHVILEEAPPEAGKAPVVEHSVYALPLSAKSPAALTELARSYAEWLSKTTDPLHDVVYTASVRRMHHEHRLCAVGGTKKELSEALSAFVRGEASSWVAGKVPGQGAGKVVFVFPGQGSQWLGMGRQLRAEEPAFREALEACDAAIRAEAGFSVVEELEAEEVRSRLSEIDVVQPVLFAIEVALAALWRSWGVDPQCVVGHSMGEVAAAQVAGMLSLEDAAKVICRRSLLLKRVSGKGAMALVELPMAEAEAALVGYSDRVGIAVSNGPRSTVMSGDPAALEELLSGLEKRGVFCRRVKVDVASHSPQMDPLREDLLAALGDLRPRTGTLSMRSTVTEQGLSGGELGATYWVKNLRDPVRFSQVTRALMEEGHGLFVELSPHPILLPSIEESLKESKAEGGALGSTRRQSNELRELLMTLGALYVRGHRVDWRKRYPSGKVALLPTYPWQRERYWIENRTISGRRPRPAVEPGEIPVEDYLHTIAWQKTENDALRATPALSGGVWLVFEDRRGLGAALAGRIAALGARVVRAQVGERFARLDADVYTIGPRNADDYGVLFEQALGGERCRGVVHLFALDAASAEATTPTTLEQDQHLGFLSAAYVARAAVGLSRRGAAPPLWLVTRGVQAAGGETPTGLAQSLVWGLGRTLLLEHPELRATMVDLGADLGSESAERLLGELGAEDGEAQVALRQDGRYVARFVRSRFEDSPPAHFQVRSDACYLVTGGLGGLGLVAARWLIEQGARHLVLVGRRGPSEQADAEILAMRSMGADVLVHAADIARPADVAGMLAAIDRRMPPLRGILHAAGVVGRGASILDFEELSFRTVVSPKLLGAWLLHTHTQSRELDFFVLYSSGSAVLGLVGQASYSAGNVFLDTLAKWRSAKGLPAMSVQWGAFAEVGLAASWRQDKAAADIGLGHMTPRQGVAALARLLGRPRPEVAVMHFDVKGLVGLFPHLEVSPFFSDLRRASGGGGPEGKRARERQHFLHDLSLTDGAARSRMLAQHLREVLGAILRMSPDRIQDETPFHALGVDSLMSLELRNRLEASLRVKIPVAEILQGGQIDALVRLVEERIAPKGSGSARTESIRAEEPARAATGRWIVVPQPVEPAKMRLFCFPYAGGAASIFASWPRQLPPEIELCAIQPPGRHERLGEPLVQRVEEMVDGLLPAMLPLLDRPFAVFGHCLGAVVAFEVLRRLAETHGLRPVHVFASGAPAPPRYTVPNLSTNTRAEFVDVLRSIGFAHEEVLRDEEAVRDLLPAVQADFGVAARYQYVPSPPLDVRLTSFAGQSDTFAPPEIVAEWSKMTLARSSHIVFPGEHYFLVPEQATIVRVIGQELLHELAVRVASPGRWIESPMPRVRPRIRLVCFPGVGQSHVFDRTFCSLLGDDVEVHVVELPGRGRRVSEAPLSRIDDALDPVVRALGPHLEEPFAFFGADVGALVMFEVARRLRRDGKAMPSHLVVGAMAAPQLHYLAPLHRFPAEHLHGWVHRLGITVDPGSAGERALRADCAMMANYAHVEEHPLDVPVTAFMGEADTLVTAAGLRAWAKQTTKQLSSEIFPGNHGILQVLPGDVVRLVKRALASSMET